MSTKAGVNAEPHGPPGGGSASARSPVLPQNVGVQVKPEPTQVVSIVGPTASGKTSLAVALATALAGQGQPAEIVNTDSMLVYRGMDIGTAKPTVAERGGVPHHLIDLWEVTHTATVSQFQGLARTAVAECHARGVLPILVGGSALYVRAVLDEFEFPGTDPAVRARWEDELARRGAADLHRELTRQSPRAAIEIEPGNARRIVRALEVIELTGSYRSTLPSNRYALPGVVQLGLDLDRPTLDVRIEQRVERMWDQGLVAEVQGLLDRGLRQGRTASRAIGYAQVIDLLDGRLTDLQARTAVAAGTRRYARKQLGWWRRDERIIWLNARDADVARLARQAIRR